MLSHPFRDPALRDAALTTRSRRVEHPELPADNQRLEFLGDAVLELVSSRYLYRRFPDAQEGELTVMRVRLTDETALAAVAFYGAAADVAQQRDYENNSEEELILLGNAAVKLGDGELFYELLR